MTKISAFVTAGGRVKPDLLQAVLKRARFADELILIKISGRGIKGWNISNAPDRVETYSEDFGTYGVGPMRMMAQPLCTGDYIICLDDDEILSKECALGFKQLISDFPDIDVFFIPFHNYILGRKFNTEYRPTLYKNNSCIKYFPTSHSENRVENWAKIKHLDGQNPICIQHLSHPDISTFIEKTNRYTSFKDRSSNLYFDLNKQTYEGVVRTLYEIYNTVDALKHWEETQTPGQELFDKIIGSILEEN